MEITTATATRQGTGENNADAAVIHRLPGARIVAAAIVDGIGHSEGTPEWAQVAAEVAARVAARKTTTIGILSAADLTKVPDSAKVRPDGVGVVAVADPDDDEIAFAWTGDSRLYAWTGDTLEQLTTDHTVGQYLRYNGVPMELAKTHDNWLRTTIGKSNPATVHGAATEYFAVILTSDGVHDQLEHEVLEGLVREHIFGDLQVLADAIVAAVVANESGYRDDATVIALLVS